MFCILAEGYPELMLPKFLRLYYRTWKRAEYIARGRGSLVQNNSKVILSLNFLQDNETFNNALQKKNL